MRFERVQLRSLGRKIRALREKRNWSLRRLATISGVSVAAIQKIEAGASSPSLSSVAAIVGALGASLDQLVSAARDPDSTRIIRGSVRSGSGDVALSDALDQPRMFARLVTLNGREKRAQEASKYPLFGYVLDGQVQLCIEHEQPTGLVIGDSFHLAAATTAGWSNPLERQSAVLCIEEVNTANQKRSGARK